MKKYTLQKNENEVNEIIFTKNIEKLDEYYSKWFYIVDDGDVSIFEFLRIFILEKTLKRREEFKEIIKWICYIINMIFAELGFFMLFYSDTISKAEYIKSTLIIIRRIFWIIILFKLIFRSIGDVPYIANIDIFKVFISYIIFFIAKETLSYLAVDLFLYRIIILILVSILIIILYDLFYSLYRYNKNYCLFWCEYKNNEEFCKDIIDIQTRNDKGD